MIRRRVTAGQELLTAVPLASSVVPNRQICVTSIVLRVEPSIVVHVEARQASIFGEDAHDHFAARVIVFLQVMIFVPRRHIAAAPVTDRCNHFGTGLKRVVGQVGE